MYDIIFGRGSVVAERLRNTALKGGDLLRSLGVRTWEDNNTIYVREIAWRRAVWFHMAQDRNQ
jgi:hypothetical protein